MAAKQYIQQAAASLQQAIQALQHDERQLGKQVTQQKVALEKEQNTFDRQHQATQVARSHLDEESQRQALNMQLKHQENEIQSRENEIRNLNKVEQNGQQQIERIIKDLQNIVGNIQSILGQPGLS